MPLKDREARNEYMRQYMIRRYAQRRSEVIEYMGSVCVRCGSTDRLELDHVDRSGKKTSIAKLILANIDKLYDELMKCQLLCHDCHRVKTSEELGVPHGGGVRGKRGCPCDLCREARRVYHQNRDFPSKASRKGTVAG